MARKQTTIPVIEDTEVSTKNSMLLKGTDSENQQSHSNAQYELIIERGEAAKLSPKSAGKIYFQFAKSSEDDALYLRIDSNDGGGLHSREWINFQKVIDTISPQTGSPFKSTLLRTCMKGKSSNNASFLAAILRSPEIGLIKASERSAFQHLLADNFDEVGAALQQRTPSGS